MDGWFYLWRESSTRINTMSHNILLCWAHDREPGRKIVHSHNWTFYMLKWSGYFCSFLSVCIGTYGGVSGWRQETKEQKRRCRRECSRSDFRKATIMAQSSCFHFVYHRRRTTSVYINRIECCKYYVCVLPLPLFIVIIVITYLHSRHHFTYR